MQMQPQQTAHSGTSSSAAKPSPQLIAIPPDKLAVVLPMIADLLAGVIDRSNGRYSAEGVLDHLTSQRWTLWVVFDGEPRAIVATELYLDVSGIKCCMIRFCTGRDAAEWTHLLARIEAWARAEGCSKLDMIARKGWARHLPDYKMTHILLEKDLMP